MVAKKLKENEWQEYFKVKPDMVSGDLLGGFERRSRTFQCVSEGIKGVLHALR